MPEEGGHARVAVDNRVAWRCPAAGGIGAAVAHRGGAGTTTAAARAGTPQVVIPQHYDQHYWARRIDELGIGRAHAPVVPTTDSLTVAFSHALRPDIAARAQIIAAEVRTDGAKDAAQRLMAYSVP